MSTGSHPRSEDPHRRHAELRALRERGAGGDPPGLGGQPSSPAAPRSSALILLRYVLPGVIVLGGVVVMAFGSEIDLEGGGAIVSAGLATYFLNWLFRIGVAGDREREREDAAREYFDRHGHWPS
jgi:hypothetical protein